MHSKQPVRNSINNLPHYSTLWGAAFCGDSRQVLSLVEDNSIDLIVTSPPYALLREKEYGNVTSDEYINWFMDFAVHFHRVLKPSGSLVLEIGGTWNEGVPTRSLYHFELVLRLCEELFYLAQEVYWFNSAKLPTPAEWVNVRRIRVKDAVTPIWWLSKTEHPKADNRGVLKPYSNSMKKLLKNQTYNSGLRPSGHDIPKESFFEDNNGAIPGNLIVGANTVSNSPYLRRCRAANVDPHPARFLRAVPEFFIQFLTEPSDWVIDPFAGSNMTGSIADNLDRHWLSIEIDHGYWENSKLRFENVID